MSEGRQPIKRQGYAGYKIFRKEIRMTQLYSYPPNKNRERASVPGPRGSMTVEAALTIPLFLFAVLCLVYLLEIQAVQFSVRAAAQSAAKEAAQEAALLPALNPVSLKSDIVNTVGADRLERSIISGGSAGIQCWTSYFDTGRGTIHICVAYRVRLPFPDYTNLGSRVNCEFEVKAWTGYKKPGLESEDDSIVYITEHGRVYHSDYHCTYLQLSIQFVPYSGLSGLRNESGGRYHACEKCVHGSTMAGVYITGYGNKYHNSLSCSGLKRSIRAVKKSEVSGMGGCSRCAN